MTRHSEWFSVDVKKRAARVRSHPLSHVLRELVANGLDAGARAIAVQFVSGEARNTLVVSCIDDGAGCSDPEVLRRVGSTTSDDAPTKRGRFGQGLIDAIAVCRESEIRTLTNRLRFDEQGCRITHGPRVPGLLFAGTIRCTTKVDDEIVQARDFFRAMIVPPDVVLEFNGSLVSPRNAERVIAGVNLETPLYDPERTAVVARSRATTLTLYPNNVVPRIYEMGMPVCEMPWSLPFDVDVGQKVPLDVDRRVLPDRYKNALLAALAGPCSDLYAAQARAGIAAPEIETTPALARALHADARSAVVERQLGAPLASLVRRNPFDADDRTEAQELESRHGLVPVDLRHLPAGIAAVVSEAPTVAARHDSLCKVQVTPGVIAPPTARERTCLERWATVATQVLGFGVRVELIEGGSVNAVWDGAARTISVNRLRREFFAAPCGPAALKTLIHECAHSVSAGHSIEFADEACRLGARLASLAAQGRFGSWFDDDGRLCRREVVEPGDGIEPPTVALRERCSTC